MSTKTPNLNLTKPDITDIADITATNANWDIIDEKLKGNYINSYTRLEQFGLSDANLSDTDFASNIDAIITTLKGTTANLMLLVSTDLHPNLHKSLAKKLTEDTDITFNVSAHVGWLSIAFSGEAFRPVVIQASLETANYYDSIWSCVYNKGGAGNSISAFKATNTDVDKIVATIYVSGYADNKTVLVANEDGTIDWEKSNTTVFTLPFAPSSILGCLSGTAMWNSGLLPYEPRSAFGGGMPLSLRCGACLIGNKLHMYCGYRLTSDATATTPDNTARVGAGSYVIFK